MILDGKRYGGIYGPCIVAEVSCNHAGAKARALDLVDVAADVGAHAVKFQLYTPDDMTPNVEAAHLKLRRGPWAGRHLWDLYREAHTPREWFPDLFERARVNGLVPFASVFSAEGVRFLENIGCPAYKIASAEVPWLDLVRVAADTGKPVILSDGVASYGELADASRVCRNPVVLSCVAEYPARAGAYGFGAYANAEMEWGLSDHSLNPTVAAVAAGMGAVMVEAHLQLGDVDTLDRRHSYTPGAFVELVEAIRLGDALRKIKAPPPPAEFARRLVWTRALPAGTLVRPEHYTAVRSAVGLSASARPAGWVLTCDVAAWEPVTGDDFGVEVAA